MTPVSKFDEAVPLDSGTASGVLSRGLQSSRVGFETDLLAATPFVLVLAFFAAFVGWPSFKAVDCPAAMLVIAARSGVYALEGFCLQRRLLSLCTRSLPRLGVGPLCWSRSASVL